MTNKKYRYKHLRGRHDQRDHNRWPAGYQAQTPSSSSSSGSAPTPIPSSPFPNSPSPTRRGDLMAARAAIPVPTGGLAAMTQEAVLANRQPWDKGVPNTAFSALLQQRGINPAEITRAQQEVANQKRRTRFNPAWSLKAFRKSSKQRQGVRKLRLDADSPDAIGVPGIAEVDYLWAERPTTNNIGNENSWLSYDSYVMPLVADALTTALGMHNSTASSMLSNGTTVESAVKGIPLDMNNPNIVEDMKSGKINIEDQALVDLILGRSNTSDRDYIIVQTPDGYALRSSNYNNSGLNTTKDEGTRQELTTRNGEKRIFNIKNSSNQFLQQFMLQNKINGSSANIKFSPDNLTDYRITEIDAQSNYDIRFSPETLHKLANAQYALEYDPKVPDSVKDQIRSRIQYILGNAHHLGTGVNPIELDSISAESKDSYVRDLTGYSREELTGAGETASAMSKRYNELTEQPHRGLYENIFPGSVEFFKNFAEQSESRVNQVQMSWRFLQQKYANTPPAQVDLKQDERLLDSIVNASMPMAIAYSLYENAVRFSAMSSESAQIRSRIQNYLKNVASENSSIYNNFNQKMIDISMQQINLMNEIRQYFKNPKSAFGGLGVMNQRSIQNRINDLMNQYYTLELDIFE